MIAKREWGGGSQEEKEREKLGRKHRVKADLMAYVNQTQLAKST